jgi:NAD(P)H-dependent flavin oxidoreductase YrpB (nitropropane dioxygenase family)
MEWKTRVTELLGCRFPILQGAFGGFGNWEFAAAVAGTGAHGMITASVSGSPERLREDIRRCRNATDGTFGVNFTLTGSSPWEKMLEVCIEEGVPLETAAYKPDSLVPQIKESGLAWIHKAARVKDAVRAANLGADAVIIVGLEGTGFKSPEQLPTMLSVFWALREVKVPVIAAGGIGNARGLLGALGMGAEGVMMGTAFMATQECPLKDTVKQAIIEAGFDNAELRHRVLAVADPKDLEEVTKLRDKVPLDEWLIMLERVNLKDPDWRKPVSPGQENTDSRLRMVSLAAGVIDEIKPVKEFIDNIIGEAEELAGKWGFLKGS